MRILRRRPLHRQNILMLIRRRGNMTLPRLLTGEQNLNSRSHRTRRVNRARRPLHHPIYTSLLSSIQSRGTPTHNRSHIPNVNTNLNLRNFSRAYVIHTRVLQNSRVFKRFLVRQLRALTSHASNHNPRILAARVTTNSHTVNISHGVHQHRRDHEKFPTSRRHPLKRRIRNRNIMNKGNQLNSIVLTKLARGYRRHTSPTQRFPNHLIHRHRTRSLVHNSRTKNRRPCSPHQRRHNLTKPYANRRRRQAVREHASNNPLLITQNRSRRTNRLLTIRKHASTPYKSTKRRLTAARIQRPLPKHTATDSTQVPTTASSEAKPDRSNASKIS